MSKHVVVTHFSVKPDSRDNFLTIIRTAFDLVTQMKGHEQSIISQDSIDENSIKIVEIWDSPENHNKKFENDEIQSIILNSMQMLEAEPVITSGEVIRCYNSIDLNAE